MSNKTTWRGKNIINLLVYIKFFILVLFDNHEETFQYGNWKGIIFKNDTKIMNVQIPETYVSFKIKEYEGNRYF